MKTYFVILNYFNFEDTIKCIASINRKFNKDFKIVVVDNGSTNNSVEKLTSIYKNDENIKIVCTDKNLGFAKGMNFGLQFLPTDYKDNFVVYLNNDTEILSDNWNSNIELLYKQYSFAVLGPEILTNNGIETSCYKITEPVSLKSLRTLRIKLIKYYIISFLNIHELLKKIKKNKKYQVENEIYLNENKENVKLHGACLIFSPIYYKKFDKLYDKSFLYMEEDALFYFVLKAGLTTLYSPLIKIRHYEDKATDFVLQNKRKKNLFCYREIYKACNKLISEIKKEEFND